MIFTLPPVAEILAGVLPDTTDQYADDPTALDEHEERDERTGKSADDKTADVTVADDGAGGPHDEPALLPGYIKRLREEVERTAREWERAKSLAKQAKTAHQDALAELMDALDCAGFKDEAAVAGAADTEVATAPAAEAWRDFELSRLALTAAIVAALADAGLTTMGQLSDYTTSGKLLTDIPKIGKGKAEKIENACLAFWAEHPEFGQGVGEAIPEDEPQAEEEELTREQEAGKGEKAEGVSDEAYDGL